MRDEPISSASMIDRHVFESLWQLAGDEANELLTELIHNYLEDASQMIQALREAIAHQDRSMLILKAHSLRSMSLNLGITTLSKHCADLEWMGRNNVIDGAADLFLKIEAEYQQVMVVLPQQILV